MISSLLGILLTLPCPPPPIPQYEYRYESPAVEADIKRFPCRWVAEDALEHADCHIAWIEMWQTTDDSLDLKVWRQEAETQRDCWWRLKYAWIPPTRAWDMDRLKEAIGEGNYRLGLMPPPVPVWRFTRR